MKTITKEQITNLYLKNDYTWYSRNPMTFNLDYSRMYHYSHCSFSLIFTDTKIVLNARNAGGVWITVAEYEPDDELLTKLHKGYESQLEVKREKYTQDIDYCLQTIFHGKS